MEQSVATGANSTTAHKWRAHKRDWECCDRCPLHEYAHKHVLFRGMIPCDILFVGEAPGETENTLGYPFIGRAGKMLDKLLVETYVSLATHPSIEWIQAKSITYAITNVVACIPFPPESDIAPPSKESIEACSPRVDDFIVLASPKLIVALGDVAKRALKHYDLRVGPIIHLYHPSYILRRGGETSVEFKRWVHSLVGHIIEYKVGQHDNPKKEGVRKTAKSIKRKATS